MSYRGERRISGPTAGRPYDRPARREYCRDEYDQSHERSPEREHVEDGEGHVLRSDLNREEVVSEAALRRGRQHEEDHHRAVHRDEREIELLRHHAAGRALREEPRKE